MAELVELRDRQQQVRDIGLKVVALSVDGLAEDEQANPEAARQLLQQLRFPFESGMATTALTEKFEDVLTYLFAYRRSWTVPTSFLLDSEGHLAAVYIGRVDIDKLLSDVNTLQTDKRSWLEASLPFSGRWVDNQRLPDMWPYVAKLFEEDMSAEAVDYFSRLERLQKPDDNFPALLLKVGAALIEEGDLAAAANRFRQVLEIKPAYAYAHLQLANVLARLEQSEEAVHHCREVLRLQSDSVDAHFGLGRLLAAKGELDEAILHYEQAVRLVPDSSQYRYALGAALTTTGRAPEAVPHFRQMLEQQPESVSALNALAWVFATSEDATPIETAEAVKLAEQAAKITKHQHPRILDTLAAAYAAKGDFQKAIFTAEKAIRIADSGEMKELAEELRVHLDNYRRGEPFRESETTHK